MKKFTFVLAALFCFGLSISPIVVEAQSCVRCVGTSPECHRVTWVDSSGKEHVDIYYGEKSACE
jgi:hypothetical protein